MWFFMTPRTCAFIRQMDLHVKLSRDEIQIHHPEGKLAFLENEISTQSHYEPGYHGCEIF